MVGVPMSTAVQPHASDGSMFGAGRASTRYPARIEFRCCALSLAFQSHLLGLSPSPVSSLLITQANK